MPRRGAEQVERDNESAAAADRILSALPYTSLCGLAGLVVTMAWGFEEPHAGLLFVSGALLASAPVGMLLHLASTSELSMLEKRLWLRALMRRGGQRLATRYFRAGERRVVTEGLLRAATGSERSAIHSRGA